LQISFRNPKNLPFLSGSCSETEVSEQLYYTEKIAAKTKKRLYKYPLGVHNGLHMVNLS
jgi:methylaspartate ammonia-lyase